MDSSDLLHHQHQHHHQQQQQYYRRPSIETAATDDCDLLSTIGHQMDTPDITTGGGGADISRSEKRPLRRLLESEDSSYDSDGDNNELEALSMTTPAITTTDLSGSGGSGGGGHHHQQQHHHHDEVSRTISDTLHQEYDEYVTTSPLLVDSSYLDVADISDPTYIRSVEFALKLGYTESQVQIALMKLGPNAGQNELLAELIKLGAGGGSNNGSAGNGSCSGNNSTSSSTISVFSGLGKTLVHHSNSNNSSNGSTCSSSISSNNNNITDELVGHDGLLADSINMRPIVIDGSNVAISHGNKECFSCLGIRLCVDWFQSRGHREITVFVPMWRKEVARPDAPIKDQEILTQLESERLLVFTPSRNIGGRRMICYDDRYILNLAAETDGIVVSNDNYRDLINENPEYKKVVEERLLMYSFVNDRFMPPDDPLGRHGPSLNNFLRRRPKPPDVLPPPCPYGKKCTYGNKCKYYHPERGNQPHKSVTERLAEQAKIELQAMKQRSSGGCGGGGGREHSPGDHKLKVTYSLPLQSTGGCGTGGGNGGGSGKNKLPLARTKSVIPSKSLPLEAMTMTTTSGGGGGGSSDNLLSGNSNSNLKQSFHMTSHLSLAADNNNCQQQQHNSDGQQQQQHHKSSENLHRKLQRQLTLNPNNDPRLLSLHQHQQHNRPEQQQQHPAQHHHQQQQQQQQPKQQYESHRQLTRMGSDGPTLARLQKQQKQQQQRQQHLLYVPQTTTTTQYLSALSQDSLHTIVTRNASAPDSSTSIYTSSSSMTTNWPPPLSSSLSLSSYSSSMTSRLNSTSDTRLNMTPPPAPFPNQIWSAQSGSGLIVPPIPSHPWNTSNINNDNNTGSPQQHQHHQHSSLGPAMVRPSSVPLHEFKSSPIHQPTPVRPQQQHHHQQRPVSPTALTDSRRKLYFHLSSIFPENQVRSAMELYPDETNPQNICAAILTMF